MIDKLLSYTPTACENIGRLVSIDITASYFVQLHKDPLLLASAILTKNIFGELRPNAIENIKHITLAICDCFVVAAENQHSICS
jgi:hypothetical protein